ncbi:MAG: response regulator [Kofleriaceae bacterium]
MRILFVDNHPEFTAMVTAAFLAAHDVTIVPTLVAAKAALAVDAFDVALVDFDLDDGKGDALVRWLRATGRRLPIIAVSARAEGNAALVAAGADATCGKLVFATIGDVLARVCA